MARDKFATAMGLSPKGGGTGMVISSMEKFGLIETGGGQIKYTDLGKKLIYGKPTELPIPRETAVRNVQLFGDIYDKYGANFTDEQLRLFLIDKAGVDISEADDLTAMVGNLLKKHVPYLTPAKSGGGETDKMKPDTGDSGQPPPPPSGYTDFNLGELGMVRVSKEETIDKWDKIKQALDIIIGTKGKDKKSS